jgi:hypothetical protein
MMEPANRPSFSPRPSTKTDDEVTAVKGAPERTPGHTGPLPRVLFSSVVRSAHKGESHGGVYLADLSTDRVEQVLDWDDPSIDWEGRGGDRGLRGIAFQGERIYLAASDEIFVYDEAFRRVSSFRNPYLGRCHEICISGNTLFATSTAFDSVLELDLGTGSFVRGYCLRYTRRWRARRRLHVRPRPSLSVFDPSERAGPEPGDTCHINIVSHDGGALYVCGTALGNVWRIVDERSERYARVPYGTHNARPFRGGVLLNHTATNRIAFLTRRGRLVRSFPLRTYDASELLHAELPRDRARPAFGRGLAVAGAGLIIGGSSPATVTAYDFESGRELKSLNVSKDVRNAVHGLEIWPYDRIP